MPYRGGIETVLQRCEELRARLMAIAGRSLGAREVATLEEALAWEAELRAELDALDERAAEEEPIAPAVRPATDRRNPTYSMLRMTVWTVLVLTTVVVFVVQFRR